MVGISDSNLNAGDLCWIVINSNPREYYLGEFIGSVSREYETSLWKDSFLLGIQERHPTQILRKEIPLPKIKPVRARLIDPRVEAMPSDSLPFLGEPLCHYAVLPYQQGKIYLKADNPGQFQDLEQALYQLSYRAYQKI